MSPSNLAAALRWPLALTLVAAASAQQDSPAPTTPATAADLLGPGWQWELAPHALRSRHQAQEAAARLQWTEHGVSRFTPSGLVQLILPAGGHPVLTHVQMVASDEARGTAAPVFQALLLRADGEPLRPGMSMGMRGKQLYETRHVFDALAEPAQVTHLALAVLDLAGKRERSRLAHERAAASGAKVLPLPVIGEPLEFELPTVDGGTFRSQDHRGEVILLDAWATW